MLRIQGAAALAILIFAIFALNPALARMYRWIDENGQVHYSDRVPPEYADKERMVYDEEGRLISTVDTAKKTQQSAAQNEKTDEGQQHKKAEQRNKVDKALLKKHAHTQEPKKATEVPFAAIE